MMSGDIFFHSLLRSMYGSMPGAAQINSLWPSLVGKMFLDKWLPLKFLEVLLTFYDIHSSWQLVFDILMILTSQTRPYVTSK